MTHQTPFALWQVMIEMLTLSPRRSAVRSGILAAGLCLAGARCSVTRPVDVTPRPAMGTPPRFIIDSSYAPPATSAPTCVVHLRDPEGRVRLTLRTSARLAGELVGDYSVDPAGSYGVGDRERLRLGCDSRAPRGIVPDSR